MAITDFTLENSGGGGGANTIYTADDTITDATRQVTLGNNKLHFQCQNTTTSVLTVGYEGGYGSISLYPARPAGGSVHRILAAGVTMLSKYTAGNTLWFGNEVATNNSYGFNMGAAPNSSYTDVVTIKGQGSTNATSSLLIENSSGTELFKMLDSSEGTIKNNVASPLNALTLENEAGGANHSVCGVKLQLTKNGDTGYIGQFDSAGGGTSAPTMIIESPTGMHYKAGANYVNGYHYFKTDNAVGFGIGRDTNSAILRSILAGGGGNYTELQLAYTGGDYNFIKTHQSSGGKFIFGRENGGSFEYMRIAQDGEVLIGTPTTDASAILNVASTTQGFLQPRMTGAEVEAIGTPATGLQAYATNAGAGDVTGAGWWGYDGTNWIQGFSGGGGGATIYSADSLLSGARDVDLDSHTLGFTKADGGISIGTAVADSSAILELLSDTQGFLPTRMSTAEMNAIGSPATGLMLYDTDTNQWMGYNGTSWVILG